MFFLIKFRKYFAVNIFWCWIFIPKYETDLVLCLLLNRERVHCDHLTEYLPNWLLRCVIWRWTRPSSDVYAQSSCIIRKREAWRAARRWSSSERGCISPWRNTLEWTTRINRAVSQNYCYVYRPYGQSGSNASSTCFSTSSAPRPISSISCCSCSSLMTADFDCPERFRWLKSQASTLKVVGLKFLMISRAPKFYQEKCLLHSSYLMASLRGEVSCAVVLGIDAFQMVNDWMYKGHRPHKQVWIWSEINSGVIRRSEKGREKKDCDDIYTTAYV